MVKWFKPILIPALFVLGMSWLLENAYTLYRSNRVYLAFPDVSCNEALFFKGLEKLDSLVTERSLDRAYYEVIVAANKSNCYVLNYNPSQSGLHIKVSEAWTDHLEASPEALKMAVRNKTGLAEFRRELKPLAASIADVFETSQ